VRSFRFALALTGAILALQALAPARAMADEPIATVRGELPDELLEMILRAVGEAKEAPSSRLEARRRSRDAARDVEAVLRSEGYYDHEITADITDAEPSRAVIDVKLGSRFLVADPKVTWVGAPPAPDVQGAAVAAMALPVGSPGRAPAVVAAEGRVVSTIQKRGYADAAADVEAREVVVDYADHSLRPNFKVAAGDLIKLNGIDLQTRGRTNPEWLKSLAPWASGETYDPEDVAELERRLLDVGVYESVTVALAPKDATLDGLRPVVVSLADRPRGTIELGAGYSNSEGVGVDARWLRYNRFGRADTLTVLARLAQIEQRLEGELALPHWRRVQETLRIGGGAYQQLTDAFDEVGINARADLTKRYGRTSFRTIGVALDVTQTDERLPVLQTRNLITLTTLGALQLDRSSDPLNPKSGWRVDARIEPTVSAGDDTVYYIRTQAQGSMYFPFGEQARTVGAVRLKLGSAFGASLAGLPSSRRFYAGGGGSVRGYAYQGVGQRLADNTPVGGLSLFEASGEVRHEFTERWGAVAFVDVGSVSDQETPDFSQVSTGVGFGVRYNLGFGPIRFDVAIPLTKREGDPDFQIYLSIGQSF